MSQNKDGGYCPRCDTVWASPGKCRCEENNKMFKGQLGKFNTERKEYSKEVIEAVTSQVISDYEKAIWNAAIEECLKIWDDIGPNETDYQVYERFRKLKK